MPLILLFATAAWVHPQPQQDDFPVRGDSAAAERYVLWAKNAADEGRWSEALASLERASDYADVSSDLSYLLALARSHTYKPRTAVLDALNMALLADRWNLYDRETALFMKIETLLALKAWQEALQELALVRSGPREAALRLRALSAFNHNEFLRYMTLALDRYPRESDPARIFLSFIKIKADAGQIPTREETQILDLILRRLPVLLPGDAELAWMAAPFMWDIEEARNLVRSYRAIHNPVPASLPISLKFGIIDEEMAVQELFSHSYHTEAGLYGTPALDIRLLEEIWDLLQFEESKEIFRRNLSSYSGVIIEDADRDGIPETFAEYHEGRPVICSYNLEQDGIPELIVYFEAGEPRRAMTLVPVESPPLGASSSLLPSFFKGNRKAAVVHWERYPAVLETEFDGAFFIPRPLDFFYQPCSLEELWGSGVLFPKLDPLSPSITRRVLVSYAIRVERPSLEFEGAIEIVELNASIPIRAREYYGALMVSETEFLRGRPQLQRVDLNMDGRFDTVRFFNRNYRQVELEDLWDFDRNIDRVVNDWDGEYY